MASVLSDATHRDVVAYATDPARIASPDMRAMFEFLNIVGYSADVDSLHTRYPDVGWQSFGQSVQDSI